MQGKYLITCKRPQTFDASRSEQNLAAIRSIGLSLTNKVSRCLIEILGSACQGCKYYEIVDKGRVFFFFRDFGRATRCFYRADI
jgi:hypothetical protein